MGMSAEFIYLLILLQSKHRNKKSKVIHNDECKQQ
jgi:hypothetical protein